MSNDVAVKENEDVFIQENVISLKGFPPVLKKVGRLMLESDKPLPVAQAASDLGLSPQVVYTAIWKAKKKGRDFNKFIHDAAMNYMQTEKVSVVKALVSGAVSDSHADRKLYFQLTGDLKENTVNTTQITLAIGINALPAQHSMNEDDKGVIDVEPVIPDDAK